MKIEENFYSLESTKGSYSYLIKDKETILIDPGKVKNIIKHHGGLFKDKPNERIKELI